MLARGATVSLASRSTPRASHARATRVGRARVVAEASRTIDFIKYQGLGNDFILIDNRDSATVKMSSEAAAKMCDRNFGIGGDGVIFAMPPNDASEDYSMRMFNSDGSEPEMCGNGIRCLARFVSDLDAMPPKKYKVGTLAGLIQPEMRADGQVAVDMGMPIFEPSEVPTTLAATQDGKVVRAEMDVDGEKWLVNAVSMGNPHCITFGRAGGEADGPGLKLDEFPLSVVGPKFESHPCFPARTNTEFTQVVNRNYVKMHVWERGAGATLACGTGACATVVAGVLEGRVDRRCTVELPGGPLEIEWRESDGRIIMTGPAEPVFAGGDDAATPDWAKDLVLDERGDLIDAKTGEPLNEFGATRFDLYVRALRGEYDAPYDTSERDDGEIMETIQQFPAKYTYQVVTTAETASEEGFVSGLVEKIAGAAGEAKVEVEVKPRGKKYSSIWCTMFVFSAKEVSDTIREIKDYDARIKMCF